MTMIEAATEREPRFKYYDVIVTIFVAVLLISQTTAGKAAHLGFINISAGVILFPISYIFGDVLTEVYGYARSRRVIWLGFLASAMMSVVYWIVGILPPAAGWNNQNAYMTILGQVPRVALGSLIAYWAGEFMNSFVLSKLKILTKGRYLWTRTIGSTIVGEAVDTAIVVFIAFYKVWPTDLLVSVALNLYWIKVVYEIIATPLTYAVVHHLKRAEGIDVFDHGVSYNPFRVGTSQVSEGRERP